MLLALIRLISPPKAQTQPAHLGRTMVVTAARRKLTEATAIGLAKRFTQAPGKRRAPGQKESPQS